MILGTWQRPRESNVPTRWTLSPSPILPLTEPPMPTFQTLSPAHLLPPKAHQSHQNRLHAPILTHRMIYYSRYATHTKQHNMKKPISRAMSMAKPTTRLSLTRDHLRHRVRQPAYVRVYRLRGPASTIRQQELRRPYPIRWLHTRRKPLAVHNLLPRRQ